MKIIYSAARIAALAAAAVFAVACSTTEQAADAGSDAGEDGGRRIYTRAERGEPVDASDISAITRKYLDVIGYMDYFTAMDDRLHGWPASAPTGYWYGTWWSGIGVTKKDGVVTFLHDETGADNNGMRTAPMMSGAMFAWDLWKKPQHKEIVRKIIRGFNSWILAMERQSAPDAVTLMTRAHYPAPVSSTDGGRSLFIDYSKNRPGLDNGACKYVHIADNPYWGDIWVKNMRSKDDIGHIYIELAMLSEMVDGFNDPELKKDYDEMVRLYGAWGKQVEADGSWIATYDKSLNVYLPEDDLAYLIKEENLECTIIRAIRMFRVGDPGEWKCGNGISVLEIVWGAKNDNAQQLRSFHEADVAMATWRHRYDIVNQLLPGLAKRIDTILDAREGPTPPAQPGDQDMAELVLMSANVGLPLTWREVRFLHDRIQDAYDSFRDPSRLGSYRLFDPATPDGAYAYDIEARGLHFRHIGTLLGLCASPYLNPTTKPALDCDMIRAAGKAGAR